MDDLISVSEALKRILSAFSPLDPEQVPLDQCSGRVLAEDIYASLNLPPFANSSMDGFSVRASDSAGASSEKPIRLSVVGDVPAGSFPKFTLQPGQAARIMTGAPLPAGADAVIPVERTDFPYREVIPQLPPSVQVLSPANPGDNVRPEGQDVRQGERILASGHLLSAQEAGILASIGQDQVQVFRRPRVVLISTGDELIQPGLPWQPGKIYDSNSTMLGALLSEAGAQVIHLGPAPDHPDELRRLFTAAVAHHADLILTSAGVSVGAFDFVRAVIEQQGELSLWRVNMRPGKPLVFGSYQSTPLIGLPGNPVSAFVGFQVFVIPVLHRLGGLNRPLRYVVRARLQESIDSDGRETYLRGIVKLEQGEYAAHLTGHQGSGNIYSLVLANALLIVPSGVKSLPSGSLVDAWLLSPAN